MIASMTGYGRGEVSSKGITASVEVRSVNSRFLEVSVKSPLSMSQRENDIKEIVRSRISRGKVSLLISLERPDADEGVLKVNKAAAKAYYKLLNDLRGTLKLKEKVSLMHMLKFSEVFEPTEEGEEANEEWSVVEKALTKAMDEFGEMRKNEGKELMKDLRARINHLAERIDTIEKMSQQRIPEERARLQQRIQELLQDKVVVDTNRLELEIALLADKLDVTEECVRFRSHNTLFLDSLVNDDASGRKLNFLVQEMNREANTIGSKSGAAEITHIVVNVKEELEKIREQLQNIE